MNQPLPPSDKRVAILTEAGGFVGFGHLSRMDELARGFEARGNAVTFIVQWEGGERPQIPIDRRGIRYEKWRTATSVADLCDAHVAIIDSYLLPPYAYTQFAKNGLPIIAVDDFYRFDASGIAFINPNCFGEPTRYPRAESVLTGPEHVIVRRAVVASRSIVRPARIPRSALVTLGGADRGGCGLRIGRWLTEAGYRTCVIQSDQSAQHAGGRDIEVISHCDETSFITKMLAAELVVCGGGQTLIESLVLGCNVVPIELGECHRPMIQFLLEAGQLDERIHFTMASLREKVLRAAERSACATVGGEKGACGDLLIDGSGTQRIVDAVCGLFPDDFRKRSTLNSVW